MSGKAVISKKRPRPTEEDEDDGPQLVAARPRIGATKPSFAPVTPSIPSDSDSSDDEDEVGGGGGSLSIFAKPSGGGSAAASRRPGHSAPKAGAEAIVRSDDITAVDSFGDLGLDTWIVKGCRAMGLHRPSPIQCGVIPSILSGRDVIGCAQTGSGKTAAFALPILHHLAADPYGVHTVVLTPSRELAVQIAETFEALGAPVGARICTIIGGGDITKQSAELAKKPHIVIATPGRLAHHLTMGAIPSNILSHLAFLVLDEADRLLDPTFGPDLSTILSYANPGRGSPPSAPAAAPVKRSLRPRQTLLFSATIPVELETKKEGGVEEGNAASETTAVRAVLDLVGLNSPFRCDTTPGDVAASITVSTLRQEYLFIPSAVKNAYLFCVLLRLLSPAVMGPAAAMSMSGDAEGGKGKGKGGKGKKKKGGKADKGGDGIDGDEDGDDGGRCRSAIVFVSTVGACQQVAEMLIELGLPCAALHSGMPQRKRIASLAKFKSVLVPVLVATDVASRGLDIPTVDLVVNYDVPLVPSDYIHRVGRTARAGRGGRSVTLATETDVTLVQAIESNVLRGNKMTEMGGLDEEEVLLKLTKVTRAWHLAKTRLLENGFEEMVATHAARKREGREKAVAAGFLGAAGGGAGSSASAPPKKKAKTG